MVMSWLKTIKFNTDGLIPAIAQDRQTGRVLMVAWMNAESLTLTVESKTAVYFSRSRQKLWHKGESSGHTQQVHGIRLDCDGDVLVLSVTQVGGIACHTGRESCFYRELDMSSTTPKWQVVEPVLKDPAEIYQTPTHHTLQNQALQSHVHTSHADITQQTIETNSVLSALDDILAERKQADADSSYVASLYHKGLNKILEKVGEECSETIISAKDYQMANSLTANDDELNKRQHDLVYEVADIWFHTLVMLAWFDIGSDKILTELARRFGMSGIEEKANRTK